MRMYYVIGVLITLFLASCGEPPMPPSDEEMIRHFATHEAAFRKVYEIMSESSEGSFHYPPLSPDGIIILDSIEQSDTSYESNDEQDRMFGGFFFFWAFPWDGRALRFKSSPKGCGLYSAIPNAWLKTPLAGGVLLHTASCVLVMLLLNCRFFLVRVWHVCSLVGWLCFRYSDVIIRIFG